MELAGIVRVGIEADPKGLRRGFREAKGEAQAFDREVSGSFQRAARGANEMGGAASRASQRMAAGNDNVAGSAIRMRTAFAAVTPIVAGLAATMSAGALFNTFLRNTIEAEQVQTQLAAALRSTGGASKQSIESLNAHAAALQKVTTFGDEAINGAQRLLLTFTKISGETFPQATEAVLNVATAMGTDLKSAALQIGKALNDPILGMTALSRSGIQFTDAQKEQVKSLVESNRMLEAQNIILKELEVQFGGSARAARETFGGALTALQNAFGDLFELGKSSTEPLRQGIESLILAIQDPAFVQFVQFIGTTLFGALSIAVQGVSMLVNSVSALVGFLDYLGIGIEGAGVLLLAFFGPAILSSVVTGLTTIGIAGVRAFMAITAAMLANPFGLIIAGITAVVALLYKWRDSLGVVGEWFDWLFEKASFVIETIKTALQELGIITAGGGEINVNINGEDAANKIRASLPEGAGQAAPELENAVARGGQSAAAAIQAAQNAAVARYEQANGKVVKEIGGALIEGGKYLYNSVTGEVRKAAGDMGKEVAAGGDAAAKSIQTGMASGGGAVAQQFELAGNKVGGAIADMLETRAYQIARLIEFQMQKEIALLGAEAAKLRAEARKADAEADAIRRGVGRRASLGGGGGSGSGGSGGGGGISLDPWSNMARTPQVNAAPTVTTRETTGEGTPVEFTAVNVFDPNDMLNVMKSAAGQQLFINIARANREDLTNILGSAS